MADWFSRVNGSSLKCHVILDDVFAASTPIGDQYFCTAERDWYTHCSRRFLSMRKGWGPDYVLSFQCVLTI